MADHQAVRRRLLDGEATAALTATLWIATACWVVAIALMDGMDMGVATRLGSFASFAGLWVAMMAAMMLPGAAPAVLRRVRAVGQARGAPVFLASYLAVWLLAGLVLYAVYRPHGTTAAGAAVIAAGMYELTPVKQHCRRHCRESSGPGLEYGLYCLGSSLGLMLILVALGVMSLPWMAAVAALIAGQKLLPARAAIDAPLALAIVGLGTFIVLAPASVPGLTPSMM